MHTEVILTKNIQGLGGEGDRVSVAPGYARNYLLPRGLAKRATEASIKHIEALKKKRVEREAAEKSEAEELATKIGKLACSFTVKTGQQDKMFGSITSSQIHEFLAKEGVNLERKQVGLEKPIHQPGEHHVSIHLAQGVTAQLSVKVVAEKIEAPVTPGDKRGQRPDRKGGARTLRTDKPEARAASSRKPEKSEKTK